MTTTCLATRCSECGHERRYHDSTSIEGLITPACYAVQDGHEPCDIYHAYDPEPCGVEIELWSTCGARLCPPCRIEWRHVSDPRWEHKVVKT